MAENKITLSRSLSTKDLVVYGIIFMIPVAPIAFYGSFLSPAHGMVALAYLIGMIAMLFTDLVMLAWLVSFLTLVRCILTFKKEQILC